MKVMDLRCAHGHTFEGWFASGQEWQRQSESGLVACPICGDAHVQRLPSAPHLNLGAKPSTAGSAADGRASAAAPASASVPAARQAVTAAADGPRHASPTAAAWSPGTEAETAAAQLQAMWLQAVRRVMANTQDVGERFPEEARRIHYGEEPQRPIRGQASRDEVEALLDEGIELMSLPIPAALKGPVQ